MYVGLIVLSLGCIMCVYNMYNNHEDSNVKINQCVCANILDAKLME